MVLKLKGTKMIVRQNGCWHVHRRQCKKNMTKVGAIIESPVEKWGEGRYEGWR